MEVSTFESALKYKYSLSRTMESHLQFLMIDNEPAECEEIKVLLKVGSLEISMKNRSFTQISVRFFRQTYLFLNRIKEIAS